jgi:hypothetical protein
LSAVKILLAFDRQLALEHIDHDDLDLGKRPSPEGAVGRSLVQ